MSNKEQNAEEALALAMATLTTAELAALARGEVDGFNCIMAELARRGVNTKGDWVGFIKAEEERSRALQARDEAVRIAARSIPIPGNLVASIAADLGVRVLEARGRDSLDFHEVHVTALVAALDRAWRGA